MSVGPNVWAFGGGKGGVGKSVVCAAVGAELASRGRRVVLLDADLGAANLHTLLGIAHPNRTLGQFIADASMPLQDVAQATSIEGLELISGAGGVLHAAQPRHAEKVRLIEACMALDADELLIDLGAGTHPTTLDFFNMAARGLVITGREPTAVQNAYGFLKSAVLRRLERGLGDHVVVRRLVQRALVPGAAGHIGTVEALLGELEIAAPQLLERARQLLAGFGAGVVVNQATPAQGAQVVEGLSEVTRRFVSAHLEPLPCLPVDPAVPEAVRHMSLVSVRAPEAPFCAAIGQLVDAVSEAPAPELSFVLAPDPQPLGEAIEPVEPEATEPASVEIEDEIEDEFEDEDDPWAALEVEALPEPQPDIGTTSPPIGGEEAPDAPLPDAPSEPLEAIVPTPCPEGSDFARALAAVELEPLDDWAALDTPPPLTSLRTPPPLGEERRETSAEQGGARRALEDQVDTPEGRVLIRTSDLRGNQGRIEASIEVEGRLVATAHLPHPELFSPAGDPLGRLVLPTTMQAMHDALVEKVQLDGVTGLCGDPQPDAETRCAL